MPSRPLKTDKAAQRTLEGRAAALVNTQSGLASDYLNVFNSLVMLVEQLSDMPDLIADIVAWRPISYIDYFDHSNLPGRAEALENYQRISADLRGRFEEIVAELDRCATGAVVAIRLQFRRASEPDPDKLRALCAKTCETLHTLLRRASDLVDHGLAPAEESAQMRADRLLAVRIQALRDLKSFQDR